MPRCTPRSCRSWCFPPSPSAPWKARRRPCSGRRRRSDEGRRDPRAAVGDVGRAERRHRRGARHRQDLRRRRPGAPGRRSRLSRRAAHDAARPQRLRQDDAAQDHRRLAAAERRRRVGARAQGDRPRPGTRLRLPGLRPDALGDRAAQRGVRAGTARRAGQAAPRGRATLYRRDGLERVRGPLSARALGRHAPARRPRPGARGRRRCTAHGRAVFRGRRADAAQVPGGPAAPAADREEDGDLRHPQHRRGGVRLRPGRPPLAAPGPRLADHPDRPGDRRGARRYPPRQGLSRYRRGDLADAQAIPDLGAGAAPMRVFGYRLPMMLSLLFWAAVWEAVGRAGLVFLIPPFTDVLAAVAELAHSRKFLAATKVTLSAFAEGMGISVLVGVPLGFLMGRIDAVDRLLGMWVNIFVSAPLTALVPVIMILFGLGQTTIVMSVVLFAVWIIALDTRAGIRQVSPSLIDMARSFGAGRGQLYLKILIWAALPEILAGIRIGLIRGVKGVVIGQLL